jgi:hypothetical protein
MTRHAGLMHPQLADRTLAVADGIEDLPPPMEPVKYPFR